MKNKTKKIICIIALILSVAWIVIIKTVDVGKYKVKSNNTDELVFLEAEVGLYTINDSFHELWAYDDEYGYNKLWYDISWYSGLVALGVVGILGLFGLIQLIKRRSLFKVDHCILAAGVLYIITGGLYVFFNFVVINYRPILMPGYKYLEASFPSSHTVLIIVVMGSVMLLLRNYINNKPLKICLQFLSLLDIIAAILGRFICGVHWFSDIIGGMLISLVLLSVFSIFNKKNLKETN